MITATDNIGCTGTASYTVTIASSGSNATTTGLTSSLNPSRLGKPVAFTAVVTPNSSGHGSPTGNVSFTNGAATLGTSGLDSLGRATFTTSSLALGTHTIKASYSGDATFSPSESSPLAQTVLTVGGCRSGDDTTLCLIADGRFRVEVAWRNPYDGGSTGVGHATQLTRDTGYFWFFAPSNMELVVKILDGRAVNGRFWFFYGSLIDVEYTITATDTQTGAIKTYHNPPRHLGGGLDTGAFSDRPAGAASEEPDWLSEALTRGESISVSGLLEPLELPATPARAAIAAGACAGDEISLCLLEGRFDVSVLWTNYNTGSTGVGHTLPITSESGCFWFFEPTNVELAVKVLDGRAVNGKFWILYGALSDVEYTIKVMDTQTGAIKSYHNPPHVQASVSDIDAFPP